LVEFSVGHVGVDGVAIIRDLVFIGKIGLEDAKDFTRDTFNEFFEFLDILFSFLLEKMRGNGPGREIPFMR